MKSSDFLDLFDVGGLNFPKTVIRCKTREEAEIFLEYLVVTGIRSRDSIERLIQEWYRYGEHTCYHICQPSWCYDQWYIDTKRSYYIVDFSEIYKPYRETPEINVEQSYSSLFE